MRARHFGHSDVGLRREHNEDAFLCDAELGLYVVCDGVGGKARGEVASAEAVELIWEWIKGNKTVLDQARQDPSPEAIVALRRLVQGAIQNATYMLHSMGELNPEQRGMSTTASCIVLAGSVGVVGQVGDSRVYLARDEVYQQITEDHTLINYQIKHGLITPEEAKTSRVKNVITRAVGHRDYVEVDTIPVPIFVGDKIMLCSDGLHGYLETEDELANIMKRTPQAGVLEAIKFANDRGGSDNVTALMIELTE